MKLMTLNIWGGHVRDKLLDFIANHQDADVICLQEVYHNATGRMSTDDNVVSFNIFAELHDVLKDYDAYFQPVIDIGYGIGLFVKKNLNVLGEGAVNVHDNPGYPGRGPTHPRILQWLDCVHNNQTYTIMNFHGLWNGQGKTDSPARIEQSKKVSAFMQTRDNAKVLCGDFNLRPDTQSLSMLENNMENLIKRYNITSTRTSYYPKDEKYADYILTSPDITVNDFTVLPDEVSDHAPLLIDFS